MHTTADGSNWHRDARYTYYPHGPLARTELGSFTVQGIDHVYTLQGWLKGINGDLLHPTTDMGHDGDLSDGDPSNDAIGRDAYALSLGYYGDTDYMAITPDWVNSPGTRPFAPVGTAGTANTVSEQHKPLYNGNIAHTVNTLMPSTQWSSGDIGQVLAQVYHYDQLNRLRVTRAYTGMALANNTWDGVVDATVNRYRSVYGYDANGNIQGAARFDGAGNWYDHLTYGYHQQADDRPVSNRLYHVLDDADQPNQFVNEGPDGAEDIPYTAGTFDPQEPAMNSTYNYGYDALGNLVRDTREDIADIEWTVAGKVRHLARPVGSPRKELTFGYGASGQRITKTVADPDVDAEGYREHYIRDAQGNIMATYRYTNPGSASLQLTERPLYGSSRLGSLRKPVELHSLATFNASAANPVQQVDLHYELTDHLGNVTTVLTGRLLPQLGMGNQFQPELVSNQGYEPFGSILPGRNFSASGYRFGFNGKENDNEVFGSTGTFQDYGMRGYDTRIGRFPSVDPVAAHYPWLSPYQFSGNSPIRNMDMDGLEPKSVVEKWDPTRFHTYESGAEIRLVEGWWVYQHVTSANPEMDTYYYYDHKATDPAWKTFTPETQAMVDQRRIDATGRMLTNVQKGFVGGALLLTTAGAGSQLLAGSPLVEGLGPATRVAANRLFQATATERLTAGAVNAGTQFFMNDNIGDFDGLSLASSVATGNPFFGSAMGAMGKLTPNGGFQSNDFGTFMLQTTLGTGLGHLSGGFRQAWEDLGGVMPVNGTAAMETLTTWGLSLGGQKAPEVLQPVQEER